MSRHFTSVISSLFGRFAGKAFSPSLQKLINKTYVSLMGLDMQEFKSPDSYPTLNALFTRSLVREREIAGGEDVVIAPADSLVTHFGTIRKGEAYQIKGMSYEIDTLLGPDYRERVELLEGGEFVNCYLSPRDYHRYHLPMDLTIRSLTHIPGKLYPVNMPLLRHKQNLFIENERVVIEAYDAKGRLHMLVLVGALNVGKMVVTFEKHVETNSHIREPQHYRYDGIPMKRGALFGWFEMGSTILLFSQKGALKMELSIDQKLKFGDEIARLL